ncbi:hypothetical protein ACHAQA_009435 [Verticillium albo-atrum]
MSRLSHTFGLACIALQLLGTVPRVDASSSCKKSVEWAPCDLKGEAGLPVECGNLTVPLDYTSSDDADDAETLILQLIRVPTASKSKKGSVLFNFGGPGEEGRNALASRALIFQTANKRAMRQGSLISTAFAARDLMEIVDAVEDDGLLRYYGLSYGSTLGATVAAMFPDRIDRLVLDGVQNAIDYFHGSDIEMYTDTDLSFSGVFIGCVDNPDKCPLAVTFPNASASDLEEITYGLLETLKYRPIPVLGVIVDYKLVQGLISNWLYDPGTWPIFTGAVNAIVTGNLTSLEGILNPEAGGDTPTNGTEPQENPLSKGNALQEASVGIRCADKRKRVSTIDGILPTIEELHAKSRILGDLTSYAVMQCAQWPIDAAERYEGDFYAKTRHPALLVGNTYDNLTPLLSARNTSESLEGSVVLQHDGYGHTSLAQPSACTVLALREYFTNGTLPKEGTICEVDIPLFGDAFQTGKWDVIYKLLGLDSE